MAREEGSKGVKRVRVAREQGSEESKGDKGARE